MSRSRSLAASMLVLLLGGSLVACGDDGGGSSGGRGGASDDELVVAVPSLEDENWLVHLGSDRSNKPYLDNVYDYLLYITTDSYELLPGLAESWEMSEDALEWRFVLREGVEFDRDYGEVTAEDVKFTLELLAGDDSQATIADNLRTRVGEIRVEDTYTMVITLTEPWLDLDYELSSYSGYPVVSRDYVEEVGVERANREPIGSGPYRLETQRPGDRMVFAAVEDHWRVVPEFDRLTVREVAEDATRVAQLRAGEVDIAPVPLSAAPQLEGADGLRLVEQPEAGMTAVELGGLFLPDSPNYDPDSPWTDAQVREALNLAIDRDAIVDGLFLGFGRPTSAPLLKLPGSEERDPYPYDVDEARSLLEEAGYADGFEVELRAVQYPNLPVSAADFAQAIAAYWEEIGVRTEIVVTDLVALEPDQRAAQTAGYAWTTGFPSFVDHAGIAQALFQSGGPRPSYWSADLDSLFAELSASTDREERLQLLGEVGQQLYDDYALVPIAEVSSVIGVRGGITWQPVRGRFLTYWEYAQPADPEGTFRLFEVVD